MSVNLPKEAALAINGIDNFEFLINFVSSTIDIEEYADKLQLLSISDLKTRSLKLLEMLNKQLELLKIKEDINQKVKSEIDQQQFPSIYPVEVLILRIGLVFYDNAAL